MPAIKVRDYWIEVHAVSGSQLEFARRALEKRTDKQLAAIAVSAPKVSNYRHDRVTILSEIRSKISELRDQLTELQADECTRLEEEMARTGSIEEFAYFVEGEHGEQEGRLLLEEVCPEIDSATSALDEAVEAIDWAVAQEESA